MGHWAKLIDPAQKVFEGQFTVRFYKDKIQTDGYCFHCQSRTQFTHNLSKGQAAAIERDQQYRENVKSLMADMLQQNHQCGLLYVDKDDMDEVFKGKS